MISWIQSQDASFWWMATFSAVFFVITLVGAPMLALRIPADYFAKGKRATEPGNNLPTGVRPIFKIVKNVLGAVLIVAGVLMLALPGQGVFAILIGLMLLDFPGKRRTVRWIVSRPWVFRSINKFRRRHGRPPLVLKA